ncbi:hypothetical protein EDE12_103105 [Methylosinus sp. sav-2]|uniref:hypothetical protein n=1 Tax=Methylosinus sp. sav-2 TaxID=2485168 RepID=UPI001066A11C|nr:hypothetical protein [Methylosinus sp. sav-2]TDX65133.1 hypothetical protein EDE12_103105 [Methylosinus sp. sav-2]
MVVKASDAGTALSTVAHILVTHDVVQPEGFNALLRVARDIGREKNAVSWSVSVDRGDPILFKKTKDRSNNWITPAIVSKGIEIAQSDEIQLPFKALDIALEIDDDFNNPVSRWHLDLANKQEGAYQSGPITHLQYGGHHHAARAHDHPLKVPRWCHPPMEVALLCEVVAANFYEEDWLKLREDPNWCDAISLYERLCYSHYVDQLQNSLFVSSTTALNRMWASSHD